MNTPYIYRISDGQKWYIGSRTQKGCHPDDLGTKYFTSSKNVRPLFESNTDMWEKEILCIGSPGEPLEELEGLVLEMIDAKNDPQSYNVHNNDRWHKDGWNTSKAGKLGGASVSHEDHVKAGKAAGVKLAKWAKAHPEHQSKAGKIGIKKITTEQRSAGGKTNAKSGHLEKIASSGGQAYARNLANNEVKLKELTDRFKLMGKTTVQCKHCGTITNLGNLSRWHNDNCKEKK